MIKFGKTAAALSAVAMLATPVASFAAPAQSAAQRLSLTNAPVARVAAKTKKANKAVSAPLVVGIVVVGVGVAAAAGAFDGGSDSP